MDIWLTADTHYGHARALDDDHCARPFDTVEEMDEALVTLHNDRVRPGDRVFHLGDVVMGKREQTLATIGRLHGEQHLIAGNHDHPFAGAKPTRRAAGAVRYRAAGFASIVDSARLQVAGRAVLLHHFPYVGDSHDQDRYREFRPVDRGQWLFHGHVHGTWRQRSRMVDVGVDAWAFRPVHLDELAELIAAGPRHLDPLPHDHLHGRTWV